MRELINIINEIYTYILNNNIIIIVYHYLQIKNRRYD